MTDGEQPNSGKSRVLVIEDEEPIRGRICKILEFEGYECKSAPNGMIGVSLAHAYKPDVILCDLMMPEMDGFAALDLLRRHLRTETTPVIVITALNDREHLRKAMTGGADDYLSKPFTADELIEAVENQSRKQAAWRRRA